MEIHKKKGFAEMLAKSKGRPCKANWEVITYAGTLHMVSCRTCGTVIQTDCIPRCLLNEKKDAKQV